ncbi:MAG: hypothetical protein HQL69_19380 [Magnetococcales bacterium]|nr:hypothetical protein [Magnetococcales bacterium]
MLDEMFDTQQQIMYREVTVIGIDYSGIGNYEGSDYQNFIVYTLGNLKPKGGGEGFAVGIAGVTYKIKMLNNEHFSTPLADIQKKVLAKSFKPFKAQVGFTEMANPKDKDALGASKFEPVDFKLIPEKAAAGASK